MVLVVLSLATMVFLRTLAQNTLYNQAIKEKNQIELDRSSEKVTAFNVNYTVAGDVVSVEVVLKNEGPVSVEIVSLWVINVDMNRYNFSSPLNTNLKPGNITYLQGSTAISVTIVGSALAHRYSSWFVTARGNVVPLEREGGIVIAQLAQGIGSMALDFDTFRYYTYSGDRLVNYPSGNPNFTIPPDTYIAFGVVLTNLDPLKRNITLDKYSGVWLYFPAMPPAAAVGPVWYIANVTSDGTVSGTSSTSFAWGETRLLVFASGDPGSFSKVKSTNHVQQRNTIGAVNLVLFGRIGSEVSSRDYGQNIPFVAVYVQA